MTYFFLVSKVKALAYFDFRISLQTFSFTGIMVKISEYVHNLHDIVFPPNFNYSNSCPSHILKFAYFHMVEMYERHIVWLSSC